MVIPSTVMWRIITLSRRWISPFYQIDEDKEDAQNKIAIYLFSNVVNSEGGSRHQYVFKILVITGMSYTAY